MNDKAREEFENWCKGKSIVLVTEDNEYVLSETFWMFQAWQHQQSKIDTLERQLAKKDTAIKNLNTSFDIADEKLKDSERQLAEANTEIRGGCSREVEAERQKRELRDKLDSEADRHYRNGYAAGWNAGLSGDDSKAPHKICTELYDKALGQGE
jgi:septal ring factor EnvC (AmiA/AmiB activator)